MRRTGAGQFLPNAFALLTDRSFTIANLGPAGGVYRIAPEGSQTVVLDDGDPEAIARAERNFAQDRFTRADIDAGRHGVLGNLASVTLGGADFRTVFLGSLFALRIATFRSPVAGARPPHWDYRERVSV